MRYAPPIFKLTSLLLGNFNLILWLLNYLILKLEKCWKISVFKTERKLWCNWNFTYLFKRCDYEHIEMQIRSTKATVQCDRLWFLLVNVLTKYKLSCFKITLGIRFLFKSKLNLRTIITHTTTALRSRFSFGWTNRQKDEHGYIDLGVDAD